MKAIAISKSLSHLKHSLEGLGYDVFFEDEMLKPVDFFIYSNNENPNSLQSTMQVLNGSLSSNIQSDPDYMGTLLIDGSDKSLEEIEYVIKNRAYSPIL